MRAIFSQLLRRKVVDLSDINQSRLSRCLTTFDLTALGIGATLGAGIYVIIGKVANDTAGPSVVLSFLIAAMASVLAGLCYAEFGARVPKAGSAYVYSYVTVGEFWAFVIGWNLILEYAIGNASVARAFSTYFDSLIDKQISTFFLKNMPMHLTGLSEYPDMFSLLIVLLITVILCLGVKESTMINNVFTGVNLYVVAYVIICGLFKLNTHNWNISQEEVEKFDHAQATKNVTHGTGGFMPYGVSGMMTGAATCFYAFVGFDCIATTGEEVKNPQRAIPLSIVLSLLACAIAYCSLSAVVTLMWPYYDINIDAPLPYVFEKVGWKIARYFVTAGAMCGLSTSLLGGMFPLPRILFAMASDGLIFRFLASVNERFKTPIIATIIAGIFAGVMAMMFDVEELVNMMSIGTLLAYTLVAACVLILRYRPSLQGDDSADRTPSSYELQTSDMPLSGEKMENNIQWRLLWEQLVSRDNTPSNISSQLVALLVIVLGVMIISLNAVIVAELDTGGDAIPMWAIVLTAVFGFGVLFTLFLIFLQPQSTEKMSFKVPLVPFLPAISMFVNLYLMMKLDNATWIRFAVWMAIGFLIYFGYGVWNSSERRIYHLVQTSASSTRSLAGAEYQGVAAASDLSINDEKIPPKSDE